MNDLDQYCGDCEDTGTCLEKIPTGADAVVLGEWASTNNRCYFAINGAAQIPNTAGSALMYCRLSIYSRDTPGIGGTPVAAPVDLTFSVFPSTYPYAPPFGPPFGWPAEGYECPDTWEYPKMTTTLLAGETDLVTWMAVPWVRASDLPFLPFPKEATYAPQGRWALEVYKDPTAASGHFTCLCDFWLDTF